MQAPKTKAVKSAVMVLAGGELLVELIQRDEAMPLKQSCPSIKEPDLVHGIIKSGLIVDNFDEPGDASGAERADCDGFFSGTRLDGTEELHREDNAGNLIHFFGK